MSFLHEYLAFTEHENTDPLWKKMVGVACLSAVVQRKAWLTVGGSPVYGNTFMLLVGEPAAGKGRALAGAEAILPLMKDVRLSSDDTNVAVAIKQLAEAEIAVVGEDQAHYQYNALTVLSDEFGVFLPEYDKKMMNALQKLYDAKSYTKETMGRGALSAERVYFTLLGACTPSYLQSTLPEEAWTQGFMSRTIMVYGRPQPKRAITEESTDESRNKQRALAELRICAKRAGRIRWAPSGIEFYNTWLLSGMKPAPTHPRLISYNGRRDLNALKIALLLAVNRGAEKIEADDVADALALLFECEDRMPEVFKHMRTGGDQQVMRELLHFIMGQFAKKQQPVDKHRIIAFLADRVPAHAVDRLVMIMQAAKVIKMSGGGYIPIAASAEE